MKGLLGRGSERHVSGPGSAACFPVVSWGYVNILRPCLCYCPLAAVAKNHTLGGLNDRNLFSHSLRRLVLTLTWQQGCGPLKPVAGTLCASSSCWCWLAGPGCPRPVTAALHPLPPLPRGFSPRVSVVSAPLFIRTQSQWVKGPPCSSLTSS